MDEKRKLCLGVGLLLALTLAFFARLLLRFHPEMVFNLIFLVNGLSVPFLAYLLYVCLRGRLSLKMARISRIVCAALAGTYGADLAHMLFILWRQDNLSLHVFTGVFGLVATLLAGLFLAALLCSRFLKPWETGWPGPRILAFIALAALCWLFLTYMGEWYHLARNHPQFVFAGIPALCLYGFLCIRFPTLGRVTAQLLSACFVVVTIMGVLVSSLVGGIMKRD